MNELEQIVQRMIDAGEPEGAIAAVIQEYTKNQSGQAGKTNAAAGETATVVADQPKELDSQSENGLSEQQEIPEVPTWLEETFGQDTFGVDFASDMYRAVKSGWRQSSAAGEIADVFTGDQSDEALNTMREKMQYIQETAQSEEMQSYQKAVEKYKQEGDSGFMAGLKAFVENPSIGPEVMVSSAVQLAGTALEGGAVSGLVAAGAGAGAAIGGIPTAGIGALPGAIAGAQGASMMAMEALGTFSELLKEKVEEKGGKFSNNNDIRNILESSDDMSELYRKAIGRGVAIGTIEAITGGIAGKIGAGAKGLIGLQKVPKLAGALAVEAAGGMAGETAGMLAAGQELAGEEIFLEGIAGAPTAIAQSSLQAAGLGDPQYRVNGKKVKARDGKTTINDMVDNASDEDFAGMRVKIKNDPKLEEKVQERRKKVIKNNKEAVKQKIQPEKATDLKRKIELEIKKTEAEVEEIRKTDGDTVAEAAENRVKKLKQQLNDIDNHINYQLDELNEEETLNLMNMDDEVSMYQSVLNDPSSSEAAKKSAKAELFRLKNNQVEVLNNTDSSDLANPEGPRKQKNIDLSKKTQEAFEKGDFDGVVEAQGGTIGSIATSLWSRVPADKQVGTYDGFKSALVTAKGGLLDMLKTYDPSLGVPLAAYIGDRRKGLRVRANRIIKDLTKQDIQVSTDSTEALNSFSSNEIDIDKINLGPKYNSQRLGLGTNLLDEAANNVELGTVAIEKALTEADAKAEAKGKPLSQKQRQTVSEKAFNKFFKDQYAKRVKDKIGKKLNQKEYIKNNTKALKEIVIANTNFAKGKGLTKDWNKYPPSDQAFQDFYEGTDTDNSQAISDRKAALAEAVSAQIGKDAKDNYFEGKEAERAKIGENLGIAYQLEEEADLKEIESLLKEIYSEFADPKGSEIDLEINEQANYNKYITNEVVPNVSHNNTNEVNLNTPEGIKATIEGLFEIAKNGFINVVHLGQMANFGRKEVEIKGIKYYELNAPSEGSINIDGKILLKRPDEVTRKSDEFYEAHEGKFKPSKGNAFYGSKDPNFIKLKEIAENNYKGEKIKKGTKLNLFSKNANVIKNKIVDFLTFKSLVEKHRPKAKNTQRIVIQMTVDFAKAVKGGANPYIAGQLLKSAYASTSGLIKTSYEFKGYENGILEFGQSEKFTEGYRGNSERRVREEHSPPAGTFTGKLFKLAVVAPIDRIEANVKEMYKDAGQYLVSFKHDEMIDKAGLASSIVEGTTIGRGASLARLVAAGIPLGKITSVNGVTLENVLKYVKGEKLPQVQLDAILAANNIESNMQVGLQLQEDSNPDPKLSNAERQTALADILGAAFGVNIITTREEAIQALIDANEFPNTPEGRIKAGEALEKIRGFNVGEAIYISEKKATADTAMHELTHTWTRLVYNSKPELFDAIFDKLKNHPLYAEAVARMSKGSYANIEPGSFAYKDEILAHILGKEGGDLFSLFKGDNDAKSLVQQFFDYVKETLGFDPATKNFADLTIDQVVKLAVKDITEGNPAANFNKLKNVAEGKSWYAKSEATVSPSAKAKADPILRALNKLKLSYRENKNLAQAINDAYSEVEGIMDFLDFARLVAKNTKEITAGKTKQLLVAKADVIKANKIAEESAKKQAEAKVSEDYATELQNKFRRLIYQAKGEGAKASKWFIPPNAEDFKGLLYTFLPKGETGVAAKKWMTEVLLKPYSDAIAALDTEILNKSKAWAAMSKGFDFNQKVDGSPYTLGDAIKVYNALKEGKDPGIAKKKHLDTLIHAVESNSEILDLANEIADSFPIDLKSGWQNRSFAKEIYDSINDGARKRHLETFSANVDAIFNDTTLDLIADQFGVKYKQALVNTLKRMKSGRNRTANDANANAYMNWLNRAVGTTMFLNTRSAVLQLLSTLNFIGKPGNNLFQATAAFANRKQWNEDYKKLWDSDYLTNRRDGAKFDVLADEIANDPDNWISKILQKGFLPTRYADSFAIALGGASFYRNRVNSLIKEGMSEADAEVQAMKDWRQTAEESQQSSDPSKISEIQASSIGKIIYAFANTPFQYARITKRKLQDLTSGRSAAEGSVQKDLGTIFYYSMAQALIFNALQSGLVALLMSDDEDDEELKEEKYASMLERSLTSFAKSTGNPGAVASTLYAMMKEGYLQQTGKKRPDANAFAVTATSISPPLNSKLRDIAGAYRAYNKIEDGDAFTPSLDNEALTMAGEVASVAGLPLDRVIRKARHLAAISNEEAELWQKIWMLAGWSEWELGVDLKKEDGFKAVNFKNIDFEEVEFKDSAFNKLERGVAGRANNDGTIEIDPNLSPVEREKTIAHEEQHMKDMKAGKLNYDDDYVYWNGGKYERKNGKIKYKGKSYIEGHKDLPWEKKAYAAEPSTAEAKKRTKLYA